MRGNVAQMWDQVALLVVVGREEVEELRGAVRRRAAQLNTASRLTMSLSLS